MEQTRIASQESSGEVPSLGTLDDAITAAPIEDLAQRAAGPGKAGAAALVTLHSTLETLMPTNANGDALLRLLDSNLLHEMRADDGTPTRALAVESLLNLGYPWALKIRPEDLAWFRDTQSAQRLRKVLATFGLLVMMGGTAALYFSGALGRWFGWF